MTEQLKPPSSIRSLGDARPQLGERVFVDPTAMVLGDVHIGDDSSIWPMAVVRGDMHQIRIGQRTSIQDNSVLHITHAGPFNPDGYPLHIGDECIIAHGVILHGCTLADHVLVGMGAIVMDGAVIESEVIIAAGSVVSPGKHLQGGFLYRGSPAKPVREISSKEREFFSYSANNYVRLKDRHLAES